MAKELTLKEFRENYEINDSYSKPMKELFSIKCVKCGSDKIELFGICDSGGCYYSGEMPERSHLIKCHGCGNAKVFRLSTYDEVEKLN